MESAIEAWGYVGDRSLGFKSLLAGGKKMFLEIESNRCYSRDPYLRSLLATTQN